MVRLPQVTLIAFTSLGYKTADHLDALRKSCEGIEFGAVKLIQQAGLDTVDLWSRAVIYDMPKYIDTDFALLIHADGYVINPESWDNDWLNYDYIGAPWPLPQDDFSYRDINGKIQRVGNSVSLRSKRLLDVANKRQLEWKPFHGYYNEDGFICVNYRHIYEEEGCRFAPLEVAAHFGIEFELPEHKGLKPFIFHQAT